MPSPLATLLLLAAASISVVQSQDCDASDYSLESKRWMVCKSGVGTTGCPPVPANVTAKGDWPTQAVYVHDLLVAVADPATCLNTTMARDVTAWLNINQSDPTDGGTVMGCWQQFQGQVRTLQGAWSGHRASEHCRELSLQAWSQSL